MTKTIANFYYGSRKQITDFADLSQYNLNLGSIFLSNAQADFGFDAWPKGIVYEFKVNPIPKKNIFVRDTTDDMDTDKVKAMVLAAPNAASALDALGGPERFIRAALSKGRQGAIYRFIYDHLYVGDDYAFAENMVKLGFHGYRFKDSRPPLQAGGQTLHGRTVWRLYDPRYLALVKEHPVSAFS
jgi:hypothetical protein